MTIQMEDPEEMSLEQMKTLVESSRTVVFSNRVSSETMRANQMRLYF
jgi:hypothetical protein